MLNSWKIFNQIVGNSNQPFFGVKNNSNRWNIYSHKYTTPR